MVVSVVEGGAEGKVQGSASKGFVVRSGTAIHVLLRVGVEGVSYRSGLRRFVLFLAGVGSVAQ